MGETENLAPIARQTWVASAVLLNMLGQGIVVSFPSVLLPGLKADDSVIKTDLETMSWIASMVGLPAFPGLLLSAFLMDRWGRKITQALFILPGVLGWLSIYFAKDVATLMAARILNGITSGASITLGAVIIGEYTSPKLRGIFLNLKAAVGFVGNTIVHIVGHYYSWRTIAIFALVLHVIAFGIVCTLPESPTWLAVRYKFDQSEKAWMWLRGVGTNSRTEFDSMVEAQRKRLSKVQRQLSLKGQVVKFLKKFTKKDFAKPMLIILFAMIMKEACGRHIYPAFALQIMEDITGDKSRSFYSTLTIDMITIISATFSSVLVHMLKRRTLLFITGGASLIILMGICTYLYLAAIDVISKDHAWIPVTMLMLYFAISNLGCTIIPLALLGELFPVAHRETGTALSGLILGSLIWITFKFTPTMLESLKVYGTFGIYGLVMAMSLVVLYCILPETKGRTLQEIEDYFNHGRFPGKEEVFDDAEDNTKMLKS